MAENKERRLASARALLEQLSRPPGEKRVVLALAAPSRQKTMIYGTVGVAMGAMAAGPVGILLVGGITTLVGYALDRFAERGGAEAPPVLSERQATEALAEAARVAATAPEARAGGKGTQGPWRGFAREKVKLLREKIFGTEEWTGLPPDELLKKQNQCNVCPICLEIFDLESGCMYMNATSPEGRHMCTGQNTYHNGLFHTYQKGKHPVWCACCNSLCTAGHRHYAPVLASAPNVLTAVVGGGVTGAEVFGRNGGCEVGRNGGQGRLGKICRLNAMLVKAWELNQRLHGGEFISEGAAKVEMVEALWAGGAHMTAVESMGTRMLAENRFLLSEMDFPTEGELELQPARKRNGRGNGPVFREPLDYPDWPRPQADKTLMPRLVWLDDGMINGMRNPAMGRERAVLFVHRKQDGQVRTHDNSLLVEMLVEYLREYTEPATFTHKCPLSVLDHTHELCDADLHPVELLPLVAGGMIPEELYEKYRGLYNQYKYNAARAQGQALPTGRPARNSPYVRPTRLPPVVQPPAAEPPAAEPPAVQPPVVQPPVVEAQSPAPVLDHPVQNMTYLQSAESLFKAWRESGRAEATDEAARTAITSWFRAGQPRPASNTATALAQAKALPPSALIRLNRQSVAKNIATNEQTQIILEAWRSRLHEAYLQNPQGGDLVKLFKDGPANYTRTANLARGGGLNACPIPAPEPSLLPPNTACLTNIDTGEQKYYTIKPEYYELLRTLASNLLEIQNNPASQEELINNFIKQNRNNKTLGKNKKTGGKRKSRRGRRPPTSLHR